MCIDLAESMARRMVLGQTGAFIDENKCGVQRYAALYRGHAELLMEERGWTDRYPASVATTWTISINQVRAESELAIDLLQVCAFLHPDAIPVALIEYILLSCDSFGTGHSAAWQLEKAVWVLMRFSLLGRRQSAGHSGQLADALSMHRLVQLVVRSRLDDAAALVALRGRRQGVQHGMQLGSMALRGAGAAPIERETHAERSRHSRALAGRCAPVRCVPPRIQTGQPWLAARTAWPAGHARSGPMRGAAHRCSIAALPGWHQCMVATSLSAGRPCCCRRVSEPGQACR